ncbi:MAG: hypothetical protein D6813_05515 [Calditrichaeota bacterium]|nr:MAG: hypothetical protein D6813_05515 [Calditrichota bacterium]
MVAEEEKEVKEVTLIGFLAAVLKWRRMIIRNFIIFSVIGLAIALLLPHWYTSTATLFPPENQTGTGLGLLSLVSEIPFNLGNAFGLTTTPSDLYMGILRSRNVRVQVIKKLDLLTVWEEDSMEDALRRLDGQIEIDRSEEGLITISATARTRERAQKMCEALIQELDRVNRNARYTTARHTREFIEKRLKESNRDLHKAAEALRDFQKKHGVISLEDQTKAAIEAAAQLRAQMALKEVEYDVLKKQLSPSHEKVKLVQANIEALQQQLDKIEHGLNLANDDMIIPFSKLPDVGLRYVFLLKDLEVQKAIYELLAKQYEQARIQEMRDTPTVEVLDAPALPERKSKPKRAYIVIAAWMLSFFVSGFVIVLNGYLDRVRQNNPEDYERFTNIYTQFRKDLRRFIPFRKS